MIERAGDGAAHEPGPDPWWTESWYVDFAATDGSLGGFVRVAALPNQRRVWCWVHLVTPEGTVVVRDHEVPTLPPAHLLARSEGLWCELVCETPMEHWAVNVEAFGVRLDDPLDAYHGEIGHRIAVGLELDWEATAAPCEHAQPSVGYAQPGTVQGEILLGADVLTFAGSGVRDHSWGPVHWWAADWHQGAVAFDDAMAVRVFGFDAGTAGTATADEAALWRGDRRERADGRGAVHSRAASDGQAGAAEYRLGAGFDAGDDPQLVVRVVPLALAPVPLDAPDGRRARLARALCRFDRADGGVGHGWAEWLQVT